MSCEIQQVDPRDDDALAAWHAVALEVERDSVGEASALFTLPELTVMLREPTSRRTNAVFTARDSTGHQAGQRAGRVVAAGMVSVPLLDNLDSAEVHVDVLPDARRRGVGTALLAHLESVVAAQGRVRLDSMSVWPLSYGSDGAGWSGVEFAQARGYRFGLGDVQRELVLPVDDSLLDALAAEAAPHHEGYTIRAWVGPVPDDLAESWLALSNTLMTEAPMGEREIEEEALDVATMRESDAHLVKQGRTRYNAVALDAAGDVVAYTDAGTSVHVPGRVFQWGTLVRRDARGHRLGLAVKVANLKLLQRERTDVRRMLTWNAEVNSHMIGVNERLGFRPVARLGEFQKRLS